MSARPPVSLSMALKCRMALWLAAHGHAQEPHSPKTERTFLRGHMFEKALFDGFDDNNPAIWSTLQTIKDYARNIEMEPSDWIVSDRQTEVQAYGFKGHSDALLTHKTNGSVVLPDCKAVGCTSYKMSLTSDLNNSPFAREYVGQLHAYRKGFIAQGQKIDGMLIIYYNVCSSEIMFRHIDYDPAIDEEAAERMSWATSNAEPTPDYAWPSGAAIPLRCGYCNFKESCAKMRGSSLAQSFKKGKPEWIAA